MNGRKKGNRSGKLASPSARQLAMEILTQVEERNAYSNLLLNQTLQKVKLDRLEANFVTELVYGTIQRLLTIDYFLDRFAAQGLAKMEPWVRNLLRLSVYQLMYLQRIPAHAIVNEAVNIAKRHGHRGISGMVNGILRNMIRKQAELTIPADRSPVQRIALTHSHPEWMVSRWVKQFGEATTEAICESNLRTPLVSVRVNSLKSDRDSLLEQMRQHHLQVRPSLLSTKGILVEGAGNLATTSWFTEGWITIQDESSMLVAEAVDPAPGMKVLDACAAPGGKTTHLAELMNNHGQVIANDIHPHKQQLIEQQVKRLGLDCIQTIVHDAKQLHQRFAPQTFDRILIDAPCSGLGVIRRKPDLKWKKQESEIEQLSVLQLDILTAVAPLLKRDGILVYSTCTIEERENEGVIDAFLSQHPQFELDPSITSILPTERVSSMNLPQGMVRILPHEYHSDGFFIAKLKLRS